MENYKFSCLSYLAFVLCIYLYECALYGYIYLCVAQTLAACRTLATLSLYNAQGYPRNGCQCLLIMIYGLLYKSFLCFYGAVREVHSMFFVFCFVSIYIIPHPKQSDRKI